MEETFFCRVIRGDSDDIVLGPFDSEKEILEETRNDEDLVEGDEVHILKLIAEGVISKEITWRR